MTPTAETQDAAPVVRITAGNPSAEDLAALVTVLSALSGGDASEETTRTDWNRRRGVEVRGFTDQRGNWSGSLRRL